MQKIISVLLALIVLSLFVASPVNAQTSATVSVSGVVPTAMGFTLNKNTASFNLNTYGTWYTATEGQFTIDPEGNSPFKIMVNGTSSNPTGFDIKVASTSLTSGGSGIQLTTFTNGESTPYIFDISGRANNGLAPGTYTGSIYFTATT